MSVVHFHVPGTPVPQGSKDGFVRGGRVILVESAKGLKGWRRTIDSHARQVGSRMPDHAPLSVRLVFDMPAPVNLTKSQRALGWCWRKPDIDKLARAVLDGLESSGLIPMDSRVAHLDVSKRWTDHARLGVHVSVSEITTSYSYPGSDAS